jgi:hypothetical protein
MSRRISPTLSALLVVLGAAAASAQGLYWESKSTTTAPGLGSIETASKTYAVPGLFKHASDGPGQTMILRTKGDTIQGLDPARKTYWELTFSEMETELKKVETMMNDAFKQMEEQLAGLPPEQRKAIEKQLAGQKAFFKKAAPGKIEVTSTDEKKTIAGYTATKHVVKEDGKEVGTVWASKDVKGFQPIEKDFQDGMRRMSSMNPRAKGMGEAFLKIQGFPLETDMAGIKTVVTKIEERAIPPAEFEVPKDYKKGESPFSQIPGLPGQGFGPPRKRADSGKPE